MNRFLRSAAAAFVLTFAQPAAADDADAIRGVINSQLQAFQADDWAGAFAHASPMIQNIFRTPEGFSRMVMGGYPMVWRPSRVEPGALEDGPNGPVQIMYFDDVAGASYVAAYEMIEIDGVWRINGVFIRKLPDAAV